MPGTVMRAAFALALGGVLACSGPPSEVHDPPDPFEWIQVFGDLDHAVLSTCGQGDDVLAVGGADDRGAILEWTGTEWRAPVIPASAGVLWWCWVAPGGVAWAVGERGTVLTRVESGWQLVSTFGAVSDEVTLYGVWGASADDIWVVGGSLGNPNIPTAIAHYDGAIWTPVATDGLPQEALFKVWGNAADDIWAVGARGTALHYDGSSWSATATDSEARLTAVWGTATDDVYAVGGLGTGVVLRWDGAMWSQFALANEELAGVWTAPGLPVYVGGNRGLLIRYPLGSDGRATAEGADLVTPLVDRDVHALFGTDDVVVAAASDLLGGAASGWRGTVLAHGMRPLEGTVVYPDPPDAGPDAGVVDAGIADASLIDAAPIGPGPGEPCGELPNVCDQGLECWFVFSANEALCTQPCTEAAECSAYGAGACCERPGFQTLETVCLGPEIEECNP